MQERRDRGSPWWTCTTCSRSPSCYALPCVLLGAAKLLQVPLRGKFFEAFSGSGGSSSGSGGSGFNHNTGDVERRREQGRGWSRQQAKGRSEDASSDVPDAGADAELPLARALVAACREVQCGVVPLFPPSPNCRRALLLRSSGVRVAAAESGGGATGLPEACFIVNEPFCRQHSGGGIGSSGGASMRTTRAEQLSWYFGFGLIVGTALRCGVKLPLALPAVFCKGLCLCAMDDDEFIHGGGGIAGGGQYSCGGSPARTRKKRRGAAAAAAAAAAVACRHGARKTTARVEAAPPYITRADLVLDDELALCRRL